MTQPIHVNDINLGGELDGLKRLVEQMDTALEEFEAFANAHLSEWTGAAQMQYQTAKKNWDRTMGELGVILNSTPQVISEIAEFHVLADRASARFF